MFSLPNSGLYAITADEPDDDKLLFDVEVCLRNGAAILQYRDKLRSLEGQSAVAARLRTLADRFGVPFIINDSLSLAFASGADGVHLGDSELDVLSRARAASPKLVIGVSCYGSLQRAHAAVAAGANYVAFGSVFSSTTKPAAASCGLQVLRDARAELPVPIVAIGGLTPENAGAVLAAGADFLAVISGIFGKPDIAATVRQYVGLFG